MDLSQEHIPLAICQQHARKLRDAGEPFRQETPLPWHADWSIKATLRDTGERVTLSQVATSEKWAQWVCDQINKHGASK